MQGDQLLPGHQNIVGPASGAEPQTAGVVMAPAIRSITAAKSRAASSALSAPGSSAAAWPAL